MIGKKNRTWKGPRPSISDAVQGAPSGGWVEDSDFTFYHIYNTGMMGPPGVGTGEIDIKPILGIDDIISIQL